MFRIIKAVTVSAFLLSLSLWGQTNTYLVPDCKLSFTLSSTGTSAALDNRTTSSSQQVPCYSWTVYYYGVNGFTGGAVTFEDAPDANGTPGTWESFSGTLVAPTTQPLTATTGGGQGTFTGYFPWLRVAVSITGTGTIKGTIQGWRQQGAKAGGSGGGGVTSIATGCGLTGGPITTHGTVAASEAVDSQTGAGAFAIPDADCGKLIARNQASAVLDTIAAPGASFIAGWFVDYECMGAGGCTITPTASTVDGAASLALAQDQGIRLVSDGSNYFTQRGVGFQNPMTALGDMISGGASGAPARTAGNTTTTQKFLSQTGDGANSAAPSWQVVPSSGTFTYYLQSTNSNISNLSAIVTLDKQALTSPEASTVHVDIANNTVADVVLQTWATDPGFPGITFIPAGTYLLHIHASQTTGDRSVKLYGVFREVTNAGVNVGTIGTQTESTATLTGTQTEYTLDMSDGNPYFMALSSSRVVVDLHAVFTGGSTSTTVRTNVGGTADSHISLPSNTVDATNFVPYTGATSDLDMGTHGISAANSNGLFSGTPSTGNCVKVTVAGGNTQFTDAGSPCGTGSGGNTIILDTLANLGSHPPGTAGNLYLPSDGGNLLVDTGSAWAPTGQLVFKGIKPPAASTLVSMNTGAMAVTDESDGMLLSVAGTGSGSESWGFVGKAYPVSAFTFVIGIEVLFMAPNTYSYFGIAATNGLTAGVSSAVANLYQTGANLTYGVQVNAVKYNNTGSYNANYGTGNNTGTPPATTGRVFLSWSDDLVTTRHLRISADGNHWYEIPAVQGGMSRTDFITPTYLGILCGQSSQSTSASYPRYAFKIFHWSGF